jgi:hypothetical protein
VFPALPLVPVVYQFASDFLLCFCLPPPVPCDWLASRSRLDDEISMSQDCQSPSPSVGDRPKRDSFRHRGHSSVEVVGAWIRPPSFFSSFFPLSPLSDVPSDSDGVGPVVSFFFRFRRNPPCRFSRTNPRRPGQIARTGESTTTSLRLFPKLPQNSCSSRLLHRTSPTCDLM